MQAANYPNIKGRLDLISQTEANMMKGKSPKEIHKLYNVKNDYTPEERLHTRRGVIG